MSREPARRLPESRITAEVYRAGSSRRDWDSAGGRAAAIPRLRNAVLDLTRCGDDRSGVRHLSIRFGRIAIAPAETRPQVLLIPFHIFQAFGVGIGTGFVEMRSESTMIGCGPGVVAMIAGSGEIGSGAISSPAPTSGTPVPPPSVDPCWIRFARGS